MRIRERHPAKSMEIDGQNSTKSNTINECNSLCCMPVNQAKTALVFFHWFSFSLLTSVVLMRSWSCLLIFPISDLAGLIRWQVGLFAKLGLWSLRVIKASRLAVVHFILPSSCRFLAISLAFSSMESAVSGVTFL